jgi:hypothetical protein
VKTSLSKELDLIESGEFLFNGKLRVESEML